MTLIGDTSGPHIAHFHARHHDGRVELEWELRNAPSMRWRVLRSVHGFADSAEAPGSNGQVLVNESPDTFLTDEDLDSRHTTSTRCSHRSETAGRGRCKPRSGHMIA